MEQKKRVVAIVAGVALVSMACWLLWKYWSPGGEQIQATGTIEATTVELSAKQAGTIKTFSVKTGDDVTKGRQVAELTRNDLAAQRERDALAVLKAETALDNLLTGARDQERTEARANLNIARVNYEKTRDDLKKAEALFLTGAIPKNELDLAETACEISKSQFQAAEARLSLVETGARPQEIEAARAEVERCKAVLKASEAVLEDLKIISPLDGVVISRNYEEGEFVQPSAALATIANLEELTIKVYIPTDDLPDIRLGQVVSCSVSGTEQAFNGVVEEIATKGEFTPKTIQTKKERTNVVFAVKIRVDNQDGLLKPGMPADVVFDRVNPQ